MESINAARRTEDIALDLLKFVAVARQCWKQGAGSTGFGVTATRQSLRSRCTQLLELYAPLPPGG